MKIMNAKWQFRLYAILIGKVFTAMAVITTLGLVPPTAMNSYFITQPLLPPEEWWLHLIVPFAAVAKMVLSEWEIEFLSVDRVILEAWPLAPGTSKRRKKFLKI